MKRPVRYDRVFCLNKKRKARVTCSYYFSFHISTYDKNLGITVHTEKLIRIEGAERFSYLSLLDHRED